MIDLALIGVSEDKRERGRRRFLDTPILMLEGLPQKMTKSDITEEEEASSKVLPIIGPSAVFSKGRVERWIGESKSEHAFGAVLLKKVPDDNRDRPA